MPINIPISAPTKSQIAAQHIKYAADKTGVDFNYLLQTAKRESAFDTNAQAQTSSATGLFQFVRQTWYETLDKFGPKHGYENYAQHIQQDKNGRYYVPNEQAKTAILNLRKDPKASSLMAAEFSNQNIKYLQTQIGRNPQASELYMAHFMGKSAAAKLINLQQTAPNSSAADIFPHHAASNKSIFYQNGQSKSIDQVYNNLAKHHVQLAQSKGLNPDKIENVVKLVPFLPSNDGFFANLFGGQNNQQTNQLKPIAYTVMGNSQNTTSSLNSALMAQVVGQQTQPKSPSFNPLPLPEQIYSFANTGSIAQGSNFFSVTKH